MQELRLASESDIQGSDILIRTTDTATLIRITMGRHFIGTMVTGSTIPGIDTIIGGSTDQERQLISRPAGEKSRRLYFFGDVDTAGADVDVIGGDGS